MASVLAVQELRKYYEDFTLGGLTLEIPKGRISGIFGANGAGKTTLMKLIAGQIPTTSGTISVFGESYEDSEKDIKNRIGYVAQEPYFYWNKSVAWTARFVSKFFANWDGAKFHRFLEEFRINRYSKVKALSRGKKTLMSIAIALSMILNFSSWTNRQRDWTWCFAGTSFRACVSSQQMSKKQSLSLHT
jgi:ABC-2 type transport system ATP-binding protein